MQNRQQLDADLNVSEWTLGGVRAKRRSAEIPSDAPAWWLGDEDASQAFLRAVGVDPSMPNGGG